MKLSDRERLKRIAEIWTVAEEQIRLRGITADQLMEDQFSQWALTTPLFNIGEHVNKLSSELKNRYPELPWNVVAGLRHRLVHDYEGINWSIIVKVVFEEMPGFVDRIRQIYDETEA